MPNPDKKPEEESSSIHRLKVSEGCLLVHSEDVELLEELLVDSECKQQLHLKLQSFDSSLNWT